VLREKFRFEGFSVVGVGDLPDIIYCPEGSRLQKKGEFRHTDLGSRQFGVM
jgi:hypothetical protein